MADYKRLFAEYRHDVMLNRRAELENLRAWIESGERVALTCFERIPEYCHRHVVAAALDQRIPTLSPTTHL